MAEDQAHVEQLRETKECEGCDLIGSNLTDIDLEAADLYRADLSGANLKAADLQGAYLRL